MNNSLSTSLKRQWNRFGLRFLGLLSGSILLSLPLFGQGNIEQVDTIQIPGVSADRPLTGFDIGFVDPESDIYVLADGTMKAVDIYRASSGEYLFRVPGFTGAARPPFTHNGPDGVLTVYHSEVWAGDGDSTVKIIDLVSRSIVQTINTGGSGRADEMAYDPRDHFVLVANPSESIPFATVISTERPRRIVKRIYFPHATNGLEQSVWSPRTGLFYIAVPQIDGDRGKGGVAVINPLRQEVVGYFLVDKCQPAGITLGRGDQLLVGCSGDAIAAGFAAKSVIIDIRTGRELASFPEIGGSDEVWYDRNDQRYYLAAVSDPAGPRLGVINAKTLAFEGSISTQSVAHSVAADPSTGRVYVPLGPRPLLATDCEFGCIAVYTFNGGERGKNR